jgi:hypothetical protein
MTFGTSRFERVLWLLCDQGIFAMINFLLNIMFARWLTPEEYGLFGVSFSGFILLTGLHWTAVLEPLLVLQVSVPQRRSHLIKLAWEHVAIVGIAALTGGVCDPAVRHCRCWAVRWTPPVGQFGGLDKLGSGCRHAAN